MAPECFIEQNNIRIFMCKLPGSVRAFSMPYHDGYTVVVNDSLSPPAKRKAIKHEIDHIKNNDHFNQSYVEYEE